MESGKIKNTKLVLYDKGHFDMDILRVYPLIFMTYEVLSFLKLSLSSIKIIKLLF